MLIKITASQTYNILQAFSKFQRYCNMTITFIDSHLHETLGKEKFEELLKEGITQGQNLYEEIFSIALEQGFEEHNFDYNVIFDSYILEINPSKTNIFNPTRFFIKSLGLLPEFEKLVYDTLEEKE